MPASFWLEEPAEPLQTPRYEGRMDVAVVGGGATGVSCALTLAEAGRRVRLYEVRAVASGASGRNGGFALRGGAMPYDRARQLEAKTAARLWRLSEHTLDRMEGLAGGRPAARRQRPAGRKRTREGGAPCRVRGAPRGRVRGRVDRRADRSPRRTLRGKPCCTLETQRFSL